MNHEEKSKGREVFIVRSHVESRGSLRVVRLEPSKAGTRLMTSTSSSINGVNGQSLDGKPQRKKMKEAA